MPDVRYENFDLTIQRDDQDYRVRVDSSAGQATEHFSVPFSTLELENFILTTTPGRRSVRRIDTPEVAAAKKFGERLFNSIFIGEVAGRFHSSLRDAYQGESRLRVRLRLTDVPELADLPWEYLYNSALNRFLALDDDTALVRYLDLPERVRPVAVTLPLKVLVAISDPSDYPRLDVEQEWASLNEALGGLGRDGLLELDLLEDATLPMLRKQFSKEQYQIFHFIGHGGFDRQSEEGVLVLKDENGRGRFVSGQQLGWLMHNHKTLALAVLNACEGARADSTDVFAGTAQSLVQQGIPAVVAMQREITDDAAKTFAYAFYSAVADGRPVEASMTETRLAIFAEGHGLEWATPVLYMRAADGKVFDLHAPAGTSTPSVRSIEKPSVPPAPPVEPRIAPPQAKATPGDLLTPAPENAARPEQAASKSIEQSALDTIRPVVEQAMSSATRLTTERTIQSVSKPGIAPDTGADQASTYAEGTARKPTASGSKTWFLALVAGVIIVVVVGALYLSGVFNPPSEQGSRPPGDTSSQDTSSPTAPQGVVLETEIPLPTELLEQTQVVKLATSLSDNALAIWYYEGPTSPSGSEAHIYIRDSGGVIDTLGIDGYDKAHMNLLLYPDGNAEIAAGKESVIFDQIGNKTDSTNVLSDVLSLAVSPNGQTIAVGYREGWVDLWDADKVLTGSGYQLYNLNAHAADVESVGFSPDSTLLATTEFKSTKVWDVQSRTQKYAISHNLGFGSGETETLFSHDGKTLAICSGSVQCGLWNVADGSPVGTIDSKAAGVKTTARALAAGFSADDQTFATGWDDGTISLWKDGKIDHTLRTDPGGAHVTAMVFAPDLSSLATGLSSGTVQIWQVQAP